MSEPTNDPTPSNTPPTPSNTPPTPAPRTPEEYVARAELLLVAANDYRPGSEARTPYVLEALANAVLALVPEPVDPDAPPVPVTVVSEPKRGGGTWQ